MARERDEPVSWRDRVTQQFEAKAYWISKSLAEAIAAWSGSDHDSSGEPPGDAGAGWQDRGRAKWEQVTRAHLRRIQWAFGGTAAGIGAAALLGWGSLGIVAFGTGIGIPIVAVTALVGLFLGERSGRELDWLEGQWRAASERNAAAELRSAIARARFVKDDEHLKVLTKALREAQSSLCIRSAFLSDHVVNPRFVALLHEALLRGVDVYIEYGYRLPLPSLLSHQPRRRHQERAEMLLSELTKIHVSGKYQGELKIGYTPTHIKELIVDGEWLVIGSHNWLSCRSFRNSQRSIWFADGQLAARALADAQASIKQHPFEPSTP